MVERIWRRLGLEELRKALQKVEKLSRQFEGLLKVLPPCNDCARSALLEQIRSSGRSLGIEIVSLTSLAESLREAVEAAEKERSQLMEAPPVPCICPAGLCTCHSQAAPSDV
jgi:hypothetical protein